MPAFGMCSCSRPGGNDGGESLAGVQEFNDGAHNGVDLEFGKFGIDVDGQRFAGSGFRVRHLSLSVSEVGATALPLSVERPVLN
jgi:hypothetical protein